MLLARLITWHHGICIGFDSNKHGGGHMKVLAVFLCGKIAWRRQFIGETENAMILNHCKDKYWIRPYVLNCFQEVQVNFVHPYFIGNAAFISDTTFPELNSIFNRV